MNIDPDIVARLEEIGREWPREKSIVDSVIAEIADRQPANRNRVQRGWLRSRLVYYPLAASVLLAVGMAIAFSWLMGGSQTLYAQVQESLRRAKSLHIVTHGFKDGKQVAAGQTWYLRDVGFRMEMGKEVRIDDGKHAWRYFKDKSTAYRTESVGESTDFWDEILKLRSQLDRDYERVGDRGRTIDGDACECYVEKRKSDERMIPHLASGEELRGAVYVNHDYQIRRLQSEVKRGGQWQPLSTQDWTYDVPVSREMFEPKFGEGVEIVGIDEVFDRFLSLEKCIYKEERQGIIFAVHAVERFEGGGVFLLTSVRGTDATLAKYPLTKHRMGAGVTLLDPPAENLNDSPQGSGFFRIRLASATHNGIDARWWIVIPRNSPPNHFDVGPGKVRIPVGFTPNGAFCNEFKDAEGVVQHVYWDIELDAPEANPLPTLGDIATRVHHDLESLYPVVPRNLDMGPEKKKADGTEVEKFASPEEVTPEKFGEAVLAHRRFWQQMDVDSQLEPHPGFNYGGTSGRALGFEYSPLADDQTLARLAKQTDIQGLYLQGTAITDAGLRWLAKLEQLERLDVAETTITDKGLEALRALPKLRTLNLTRTQITDEGMKSLAGFVALEELDVSNTQVTSAGVAALKKSRPNLKIAAKQLDADK